MVVVVVVEVEIATIGLKSTPQAIRIGGARAVIDDETGAQVVIDDETGVQEIGRAHV